MPKLPPDVTFGAAIVLLGMVMLSIDATAALWLGVLLVLAAVTYAEKHGKEHGHSFIGDTLTLFGLGKGKEG
jgi:hypothetical protein